MKTPHPAFYNFPIASPHTVPDFGESRFPGAVKSQIPYRFLVKTYPSLYAMLNILCYFAKYKLYSQSHKEIATAEHRNLEKCSIMAEYVQYCA